MKLKKFTNDNFLNYYEISLSQLELSNIACALSLYISQCKELDEVQEKDLTELLRLIRQYRDL